GIDLATRVLKAVIDEHGGHCGYESPPQLPPPDAATIDRDAFLRLAAECYDAVPGQALKPCPGPCECATRPKKAYEPMNMPEDEPEPQADDFGPDYDDCETGILALLEMGPSAKLYINRAALLDGIQHARWRYDFCEREGLLWCDISQEGSQFYVYEFRR